MSQPKEEIITTDSKEHGVTCVRRTMIDDFGSIVAGHEIAYEYTATRDGLILALSSFASRQGADIGGGTQIEFSSNQPRVEGTRVNPRTRTMHHPVANIRLASEEHGRLVEIEFDSDEVVSALSSHIISSEIDRPILDDDQTLLFNSLQYGSWGDNNGHSIRHYSPSRGVAMSVLDQSQAID